MVVNNNTAVIQLTSSGQTGGLSVQVGQYSRSFHSRTFLSRVRLTLGGGVRGTLTVGVCVHVTPPVHC